MMTVQLSSLHAVLKLRSNMDVAHCAKYLKNYFKQSHFITCKI